MLKLVFSKSRISFAISWTVFAPKKPGSVLIVCLYQKYPLQRGKTENAISFYNFKQVQFVYLSLWGGFQGDLMRFLFTHSLYSTFIVQSVNQTVDNFQLNLGMKWLGLTFFTLLYVILFSSNCFNNLFACWQLFQDMQLLHASVSCSIVGRKVPMLLLNLCIPQTRVTSTKNCKYWP